MTKRQFENYIFQKIPYLYMKWPRFGIYVSTDIAALILLVECNKLHENIVNSMCVMTLFLN